MSGRNLVRCQSLILGYDGLGSPSYNISGHASSSHVVTIGCAAMCGTVRSDLLADLLASDRTWLAPNSTTWQCLVKLLGTIFGYSRIGEV